MYWVHLSDISFITHPAYLHTADYTDCTTINNIKRYNLNFNRFNNRFSNMPHGRAWFRRFEWSQCTVGTRYRQFCIVIWNICIRTRLCCCIHIACNLVLFLKSFNLDKTIVYVIYVHYVCYSCYSPFFTHTKQLTFNQISLIELARKPFFTFVNAKNL